MAHFDAGSGPITPYGDHVYLRSTHFTPPRSYTVDHTTVPTETIDGNDFKPLIKGTAMALITASGKVGPFSAAATDGREILANIVGLNDTQLDWQMNDRDVEIAVMYDCTAVQAWCFEHDATDTRIALTDTTADAMRNVKHMDIKFH